VLILKSELGAAIVGRPNAISKVVQFDQGGEFMRPWLVPLLAILVVGVAAGGVAGYIAAENNNVTVLTGPCRVGDHEAACFVNGSTYGINESAPWLGSDNTYHESGWPDCLGPVGGLHTVPFGYTTVQAFNIIWPEVVWVSCIT
jgi:hypothetical protein